MNGQNDRPLAIIPAADILVFDAVLHVGDVAEVNWLAVGIGNHKCAKFIGVDALRIRIDRHALRRVLQRADRDLVVGVDNGCVDRVDTDAAIQKLVGIDVDAHRVGLRPVYGHFGDARQCRDRWRDDVLGDIVELAALQGVALYGDQHDRRVGRVGLPVAWRGGQVVGKFSLRGRDRRLHVTGGRIDVAVEIELQHDAGIAERVCRRNFADAGDRLELLDQRRGDRCRHCLW